MACDPQPNSTEAATPVASPGTPPARKRMRGLSVRMLMVVVLVVGAGLGWVAHRARVQREAVAAITKAGGHVIFDWQYDWNRTDRDTWAADPLVQPGWLRRHVGPGFFEKVTSVAVGSPLSVFDNFENSAGIDDALMVQIGRLRGLQSLRLDSLVTNAGLAHLRNLSDLRVLTFVAPPGTRLGPANLGGLSRLQELTLIFRECEIDLAFLRGLTSLKSLMISGGRSNSHTDLAPLQALTHLEVLEIGIPTDSDLALLDGLSSLKTLSFTGMEVTNAGLKHLGRLRDLKTLYIGAPRVTDLEALRPLSRLETLCLIGVPISDAGLAPIESFRALKSLSLGAAPITDAGLAHLRGLGGLTDLDLNSTRITDDGLKALAAVPLLGILDLGNTRITDAGLATIARLPNLRHLSLDNTAITDAGLGHLAGLTRCEEVRVAGTKVTAAGIAVMKAKCPWMNIDISADPGLGALLPPSSPPPPPE
jgi:internalin A